MEALARAAEMTNSARRCENRAHRSMARWQALLPRARGADGLFLNQMAISASTAEDLGIRPRTELMDHISTTPTSAGTRHTGTSRFFDEGSIVRLIDNSGIDLSLLIESPVDLDRLARCVGVTAIRYVDLPLDGLLWPSPEGSTIMLNTNHPRVRQRFSCAHEIAHAILRPGNPAARHFDSVSTSVEVQCDRVASVLLMPNPQFQNRLRAYGSSITAIPRLAKTFLTSIRATAIRFVDVIGQLGVPCILILSQLSYQRSGRKLRVQWAHQNTLKPDGKPEFFIPYNGSVGLQSANAAFGNDTVHAGREMVQLGSLRLRTHTESAAFGRGSNRFVVTLIYPDAKHEPRHSVDHIMTEK